MSTATFQIPDRDPTAAVASLGELGFVFGPPERFTSALVDTFDGRLHRAGLRLELRTSERIELVLSGDGVVPAHLSLDAVPHAVDDLPPGPFRSRISLLIGVRALSAQIRVRSERSSGVWRDATGKAVATAELFESVRIVDRSDVDVVTTIEIHEVAGYSKRAGRAITVLGDVGLRSCRPDTLAQCAAAADVDLAGFKAAPSVPLDADMVAIGGVRAVLSNLDRAIAANWQGAIDQTDVKFLHDLRIALRRTRTVIAASGAVIPAAVREPMKKEFAWLARATGEARDLDVYLMEWERYTGPLGVDAAAALKPVRDVLERRHADAHATLAQTLQSERATALIGEWRQWLTDPIDDGNLPRRAGHPLGKVVAKRIHRAHHALLDQGRLIDHTTPADDVHDLRKDAKKLRYLIECFGGVLIDRPRKKYVKKLKALQNNLGEHQDAEVHISLLRSLTPELDDTGADASTMIAVGQLIERLDQTRVAARTEFDDRFADYDSDATCRFFDAMIEPIAP